MRLGYKPLIEALVWMGKHRKTDVTRQLGGVMGPGIYLAKVVEYVNGQGYTDYILQSEEGLMHKERVFGTYGWKPVLGSKWRFELHYAGDGHHHIERGGEQYYLIDDLSGSSEFSSYKIKDVYSYLKERGIKLKYLRMKWRKLI